RAVELARADLSTAVGLEPGTPLTVGEPHNLMAEPATAPALAQAIDRALSNRPSLKAFALTVAQNRKTTSAARGDYWPVLSAAGDWSRSSDYFPTMTDRPDKNSSATAGLYLSWNIFSGLATRAAVSKAELLTQIAENDL